MESEGGILVCVGLSGFCFRESDAAGEGGGIRTADTRGGEERKEGQGQRHSTCFFSSFSVSIDIRAGTKEQSGGGGRMPKRPTNEKALIDSQQAASHARGGRARTKKRSKNPN